MSLEPIPPRHYRWDPYRDVDERFTRMMRAVFGEGAMNGGPWPPIDVEETDEAYIIDIDLPNVNPSDLDLEIHGEELRLTGQRPEREHEGRVRRHGRPSGDFEYLVDLPGDVDPERIEATYDNGVLTVRVGRTRDAQPRRIEIRTAPWPPE